MFYGRVKGFNPRDIFWYDFDELSCTIRRILCSSFIFVTLITQSQQIPVRIVAEQNSSAVINRMLSGVILHFNC